MTSRSIFRSVLVGSLLLTLPSGLAVADDWPSYQHDVHHTGQSTAHFDPNDLVLAWSAPIGFSTPLIVGNSVIGMRNQQGVGNDMTRIASFDIAEGTISWVYVDQSSFPSQPTVGEGFVASVASTVS